MAGEEEQRALRQRIDIAGKTKVRMRANKAFKRGALDTYDTERAARRVVELSSKLRADGLAIKGVRIDSGDLADHATRVRRIFDAADLRGITIFASGNLDEMRAGQRLEPALVGAAQAPA